MNKDTPGNGTKQRSTLTLRGGAVVRPPSSTPALGVEPEAYCIWAEGRRGPRVRHPTLAVALAEADRLAQLDPGRRFDVFALVPAGKALR